jgi:hypothetical protein
MLNRLERAFSGLISDGYSGRPTGSALQRQTFIQLSDEAAI